MLEYIASAKALASAVGIILVACLAGCATGTTEATSGRPSGTGGGAKHPTTQEPARQVRQVEWDHRAIRVEGTCQATPGTSSRGACLRLQLKSGSCIISEYGLSLVECGRLDATLLKSGELHIHGSIACAAMIGNGFRVNNAVVCKVE